MKPLRTVFDDKFKASLERALNDERLTPAQRKTLRDFDQFNSAANLSTQSRIHYIKNIRALAHFIGKKSFKKLTKKDLVSFFASKKKKTKLKTGKWVYSDELLSHSSLNARKVCTRKFLIWLFGENNKLVGKDVIVFNRNHRQGKPFHVLSPKEVQRMIEKARLTRDKCVIALLYETGCRAGELLNLTLGDLEFFESEGRTQEIKLFLSGKTGSRPSFIYLSIPYISMWLQSHPFKGEPTKPFFVSLSSKNYGEPMSYTTLNRTVKNLAKAAGIGRKVTSHSFRKSRTTHLRSGVGGVSLSDSEIKIQMGWSKTSRMLQIYDHVSGKDLRRKFRERHGLAVKEKLNKENKCHRCSTLNLVGADFCIRCGLALTMEAVKKLEKIRKNANKLVEDRGPDELKAMMTEVFNELFERKKLK